MANLTDIMLKNLIDFVTYDFENDDILNSNVFLHEKGTLIREQAQLLLDLELYIDNNSLVDTIELNLIETMPIAIQPIVIPAVSEQPIVIPTVSEQPIETQPIETIPIMIPAVSEQQLPSVVNQEFILVDVSDCKANNIRIIRDVMPVILRDMNCTWKVKLNKNNGQIFLQWSICEALVNVGINNVDAFKVKTLFGTHKKSMSERNGFKYSAEIKTYFVTKDTMTSKDICIFQMMPVIFEGKMTSFEIIVRSENYNKNYIEEDYINKNRVELLNQLLNYTDYHLDYVSSDIPNTLAKFKVNYEFTNKLFNYTDKITSYKKRFGYPFVE
jgi:hypothetical protein